MLVEAMQFVMMLLQILDTLDLWNEARINIRVNGSAAAGLRAARGSCGCTGRGGGLSSSKAGNSQNESGGVLHIC